MIDLKQSVIHCFIRVISLREYDRSLNLSMIIFSLKKPHRPTKTIQAQIITVPKHSGNKSSIRSPDHEAGDEETTGNTSPVNPTGNKAIHEKDDPEGGQRESTCIGESTVVKRHVT